jgi:protein regulator of cytokinesis 1
MSPHATSAALTALLNSLHTHLQTQTLLLPTLHSQLGLPPSTLEDDLRVLQEQLIKGVEGQVEARRKEVEEWMAKCDVVETECVRYSKALGPNFKSTGESVGELRKESILPRRYELGLELQEKSRRVGLSLFFFLVIDSHYLY